MKPKVGDKFLVPGYEFISEEHYLDEYELVGLAASHVTLKHTRTVKKTGSLLGTYEVREYPLELLDHLAQSFDDRWEQHVRDVDWIATSLASTLLESSDVYVKPIEPAHQAGDRDAEQASTGALMASRIV